MLSQFLLVQDARIRIRRERGKGRGVTGELFISKTTFSSSAFWGGTRSGTRMKNFSRFPDLVRGYIRCLRCNFSRRINLWSPLRLWRDGPKTFNLCIGLSSLPSRWQKRTRSQENARESLRDKFSHGSRNFEKFKLSHIHVESCLFVSSFIYKDL